MSVPTSGSPSRHADIQAAFAATLVDEWVRGGVGHAVVCPGSRSTPLAVALLAHPDMVVHVRLDERSAAFTGLGMGMVDGRPALVVTTSGTAAAELHAAVVEADLAAVPLIVCTADRPPELRDVGAPQTIDQTRLFGSAPRWFADPGVPDLATRSSWRSLASRAVVEATDGGRGPGPVHLNLPFREPLLGDPVAGGGTSPARAGGGPWHRARAGSGPPDDAVMASLVVPGGLAPGTRGLIVAGAGGGAPTDLARLAGLLGWPLLADPRSGARTLAPTVVGAADGILRSERFARGHRPDFVLRLGERWVSKVVNQFVADSVAAGARSVVVEPWGRWIDPEHDTAEFVRADPSSFCRLAAEWVARTFPAPSGTPAGAVAGTAWSDGWTAAEARAREVLARELDGGGGAIPDDSPLSEPALARWLVGRLPATATLVVSSSMPVRDVEAFAAPRADPPRILANRGANGIDGVVSTALGVAMAAGGPVVALVGDLAFLHDVSALVRTPGFTAPLTVVVADNGGGGIFSFLAPAGALDPADFDTLFGTPQASEVAAVASGFGWPVGEVGPAVAHPSLDEALGARLDEGSLGVIRVALPDRTANVAVHDRINAAVVVAVDGGTPDGGVADHHR